MPTIRDEAICIRHWDWSETSQTVSLFCREHGVLRCLAKGSRRDKAPFSGGVELLTRGELIAIVKNPDTLATLTAWDLAEPFGGFRSSLERFNAGMFLIDLVHHAIHDHDPHPDLYDALLGAMRRIGSPDATEHIGPPVLGFLWKLLVETGHKPQVREHAQTGKPVGRARLYGFDPQLGGVVDDPGPGDHPAWRVRAETIDLLTQLDHSRPPQAQPGSIRRAIRLLSVYLRDRLGVEPATMRTLLDTDYNGDQSHTTLQ